MNTQLRKGVIELCILALIAQKDVYKRQGEEMQFPGYFLLDSDLNVLEAHRATSILDMPSVDEMIAKL